MPKSRGIPSRLGPLALLLTLSVESSLRAQVSTSSRDSAGIRIVENRLRGDPPVAFIVAARPTVDFGGESTDSLAELVGVSEATRLRDGRFVVSIPGGMRSLRLYDAIGRYLTTFARAGLGPGELPQTVTELQRLSGDTVVAMSRVVLHLFESGTRYIRSEHFDSGIPIGVLADGAVLAERPPSRDSAGVYGARLYRRVVLTPGRQAGRPAPVIVSAPDPPVGWLAGPPGAPRFAMVLPYRPRFQVAIGAGGIVTGDAVTYELARRTPTGTIRELFRLDADLAIRPDDVRRYRESARTADAPPGLGQAFQRWWAEVEMPARIPAFTRIVVDAADRIWALDQRPAPDGRPRWSVLAADGAFLGIVDTPAALVVREIGSDYVLGIAEDATGFSHVQVYPLLGGIRDAGAAPTMTLRPLRPRRLTP